MGKEDVVAPTTVPGADKRSMDMKRMLGEADFFAIVVAEGVVIIVDLEGD